VTALSQRGLLLRLDCSGNLAFPGVGGWPLPAAGGQRRHCSDVRPNPAFCSRLRKRSKAGKTGFTSISKRSKRGGDYATPPPSILAFHNAEIVGLRPRFLF